MDQLAVQGAQNRVSPSRQERQEELCGCFWRPWRLGETTFFIIRSAIKTRVGRTQGLIGGPKHSQRAAESLTATAKLFSSLEMAALRFATGGDENLGNHSLWSSDKSRLVICPALVMVAFAEERNS
jgi:hypothetical protein